MDQALSPFFLFSQEPPFQALLVFFTGGIAGLVGVPIVEKIRVAMMPSFGWSGYWLVLTGINLFAMLIFAAGYRGRKKA